jgi:exonuclease III
MKLISINIEHNVHDDLVLAFLKKEAPDVVCIQELLEEKFDFYKEQLGLPGVYQFLYYEMDAPGFVGKKQGIGIFAKDMEAHGSIPFNSRVKSPDHSLILLWAEVRDESGETFKVATTHLPVTRHGEVTPFQLQVVDSLLVTLAELGDFIFCGDTNAPRGKEAFGKIAEKYKDNIPVEYTTSLDQDLHRVKGLQYMVDGLFTTPLYKASAVTLTDGISDHMAIVAQIAKV